MFLRFFSYGIRSPGILRPLDSGTAHALRRVLVYRDRPLHCPILCIDEKADPVYLENKKVEHMNS